MSKFIVLEGNEGCGKSTQIHSLAKNLMSYSKLIDVLLTREPWKSGEIRKRLEEEDDPYANAELMTRLYVKDRKEHTGKLVLPNLTKGVYVISDRYKYSTIAYQSCQGIELDYLVDMHKGMLVPDITFVLDVPVGDIIKRLRERKDKIKEKKFENNKDFLEKLRSIYLEMPNICKGEPVVVVDGNRSEEEISREIWDYAVKEVLQ